jgi:hypothetical protein
LFVMHEPPVSAAAMLSGRRVLLWDVAPRELQMARGRVSFDVTRRIPAKAIVGIRLEVDGPHGRVFAVLDSGEPVDLIGRRPRAEAEHTVQTVILATGKPVLE